ncbi:DUF1190 domain-containing protein [Parendozoicomonas haliclonae]|uniref:DUF1190 domain-containing protein n=1 Tax=Parendozoicomonas haliclonae TaxID=1960125 RepID=A0A1X7AR01_9GAMM|nr:DUF1190 domain-containing protein [Parendozoicomonas haliclonae]SMA50751.1 hypothetical protein EHSB41UT_04568 [Parendozoicomonas haliclonae]
MSKRSKKVGLVVLGAVPLTLTGCGDKAVEAQVFPNITSCVYAGNDEDACEDAQKQALLEHEKVAPRYVKRYDCESDFDSACLVNRQGYFIPAMAGFLVGGLLSRSADNYFDDNEIDIDVYTQPVYRSRDDRGNYRTADNKRIGSIHKTGKVMVPSKSVSKPSVKTTTLSRGGFGSSAAARGSWGGGKSWGG